MFDIIFPSISSVLCITAIGISFGLILSIARLKLNVERDPRFQVILDSLPGANCGACGEAGCTGYASNIIESRVPLNLCPVGGSDLTLKLCDVMGIEAEVQKRTKQLQRPS